MLPPWEQAVDALRETRPRDRERVLNLLQRLLQENQQYRFNNLQLSELLHKQDVHISDLTEQLQRCRRQLEQLQDCKTDLKRVPLKQTTMLEEDGQEDDRDEEEELEEEEEDRANNNNLGEQLLKQPQTNGLRRSPTPLNRDEDEEDEEEDSQNHEQEQESEDEPAMKRVKLQEQNERTEQPDDQSQGDDDDDGDEDSRNSSIKEKPLENGRQINGNHMETSEDEEMEEDSPDNDNDIVGVPVDQDESHVQAPHSSSVATPPTATTPISPDSAATAGQLFDSSNSSDESSMKKAQMSACNALAKMTNNNDDE
ncbi:uncharacterized protein Dwil_GK27889, partial [Drosophila willistoni]